MLNEGPTLDRKGTLIGNLVDSGFHSACYKHPFRDFAILYFLYIWYMTFWKCRSLSDLPLFSRESHHRPPSIRFNQYCTTKLPLVHITILFLYSKIVNISRWTFSNKQKKLNVYLVFTLILTTNVSDTTYCNYVPFFNLDYIHWIEQIIKIGLCKNCSSAN